MSNNFEVIERLTQPNAEQIANLWHYQGEYSFYDMKNDLEDYEEIMSPEKRGDKYFQILNNNGELTAFFCIEANSEISAEIGLGMAPTLVGQGHGSELMEKIENFLKEKNSFESMLLSVATFNQRALKVYKQAGFNIVNERKQNSNGAIFDFYELIKKVGY